MGKRRRYYEDCDAETKIDISPLIDIVFILVIFFVVTTVFNKPIGVDIEKSPKVESSKNLDRNAIMLGVTEQGNVFYAGRNIGIEGVEPTVKALIDGDEPLPVVIIGDRRAQHEVVVKVIDAATRAGAGSVSLATKD